MEDGGPICYLIEKCTFTSGFYKAQARINKGKWYEACIKRDTKDKEDNKDDK
jgi:hypothetical protein